MKSKKIIIRLLPLILLIFITSLLFTSKLGATSTDNINSNSNPGSVSWIFDSGLTGVAVTGVNISKDSSKDSGIKITGFIENKDPDSTKLAVTINVHLYDKTQELLGVVPIHPADILEPLQKIRFVVKDPTRHTTINLDHVYLQVQAFDCGTASLHNMGCSGQTASTNNSEKSLPLIKRPYSTGIFESKVLGVSNLSAVGNGESYDIVGKI